MFVDTHCHIHESGFYQTDRETIYQRAVSAGVRMICIGTNEQFSAESVAFAKAHDHAWATVGVHPHDTKDGWQKIGVLLKDRPEKLVGIGEIGLDYFYNHSPRDVQLRALEEQLQWARDYALPVSFHVREAYDDFWPVFDNFSGVRGVLHSFTDSTAHLEKALTRGLFIGVNGISTFARDKQAMFDAVPLENLLLETDAPFLTPAPYRGKVNEPANVRVVAEYHATKRGMPLDEFASMTTNNATTLFAL